jgi:hypothetical protein
VLASTTFPYLGVSTGKTHGLPMSVQAESIHQVPSTQHGSQSLQTKPTEQAHTVLAGDNLLTSGTLA